MAARACRLSLCLVFVVTNMSLAWTTWPSSSSSSATMSPIRLHRQSSFSWLLSATLDGETISTIENNSDDDDTDDDDNAATLRSITFCHLPASQEPDLLADFLLELGACSATVTDADAGTDREVPLFGEPLVDATTATAADDTNAWQDSLQWAAPVWNSCNVTAHFAASTDLAFVVAAVDEAFGGQFPTLSDSLRDVTTIPHQDWVTHVQSNWKPIVVGHKFVLRFPWHSEQDVQQAVLSANGGVNCKDNNDDDKLVHLLLQGGIAFGTGEHPTTQLCLQWLDRILGGESESTSQSDEKDTATFRLVDYGAGSGVLGMAACRLARNVQATGIDIDVDACRIANANAAENKVAMRNYLPPVVETADDASKSLLLKAHAHARHTLSARGEDEHDLLLPNDELIKGYDACVANILAGPLCTLAPTIGNMLQAGGFVGMSGILTPQGQDVVDAYTRAGFVDMKVEQELDGWVLVTGRKAFANVDNRT